MDKKYIKALSDLEQAGAHLALFSELLHGYHKSLCESGFEREEALELVREFQNILFTEAFGSQSDE